MKTSLLALSLIFTPLGSFADDGDALIEKTSQRFIKCSEVLPMEAILLGAYDDLSSETDAQTLKDFLMTGSLAHATSDGTPALTQECLNIASGIVAGKLDVFAEQFEIRVHSSLVTKESTCIEQYQYRETFQPLFDAPENAQNQKAAESYLKTGEILPKEGQNDLSQAKTCGTMMAGTLVSTQVQMLSGVFGVLSEAIAGGFSQVLEALLSTEIEIEIGTRNDTEN